MKPMITVAAMVLAFTTTSVLAESVVIADKHVEVIADKYVENYGTCRSRLSIAMGQFQESTGLIPIKVHDSTERERAVYTFRQNDQMTLFVSCMGTHYKAWWQIDEIRIEIED